MKSADHAKQLKASSAHWQRPLGAAAEKLDVAQLVCKK